MNRFVIYSVLLGSPLALSICRFSQAQNSTALAIRLHSASGTTALDSPASLPFHLKVSVEVFPQYGREADKGTVEIWWNSAKEHRTVYDLSQYHATVVKTPTGLLRSPSVEDSPYIVDHLLDQILHPISDKINTTDFKIETAKQPFGKIMMDCIVVTPSFSKPSDPSGTSYCFDDKSQLRAILIKPDQYDLRQTLGKLGGRSVPVSLQYTFFRSLVAAAHIESLQTQKDAYPQESETASLVPVPEPPAAVPSQTLSGQLLHRPDPIYPDEAKEKHISGTVLLHGIIGADGKVARLSLIGSPHDSLTASAMKAVSKWVYRPYMLNGVPTEVDTTITVHYTFGPY